MPSLPQSVLHAKLQAALPAGTVFSNADSIHPAEAVVPGVGNVRIYLWTVTHVESEDRPQDEYKIQLILPGQGRNQRNRLNFLDRPTFLLGYSPDFGVFVGWQASLHERFGFSTAVQVKESTLADARITGWAVAPPRTVGAGEEVRVAFSPANLAHFLKLTIQSDRNQISGVMREAFFLIRTPNARREAMPDPDADVAAAVARLRREQLVRRLDRDAKFGPRVKKQYGFACAVCGVQLGIIEGAHIIPVSVEHSTDDIWNGLALCRNHHKLFDAFAFVVTPELRISIDHSTLDFYIESGHGTGMQSMLTDFENRELSRPLFYADDQNSRTRMIGALEWRAAFAALQRE
jgi:putative restriction endonuclease